MNEVYEFFSRPENLQKLTPEHLHFQILTPSPVKMGEGARIEYKLKLHGLPLQWVSLITAYDPPHRFTDEQLKGPYSIWIHTHAFATEGDGTRVEDHVIFKVPGGRLVEKLFVQKNLASIFRHRHQVIEELFRV